MWLYISRGFWNSGRMQVGFYLLLVVHVTEGCTLLNNRQTKEMTTYIGGSILLPCYCTDLHTKPETFTWNKHNAYKGTWKEISSESGQYRNRVQLGNAYSPGNLSLLISHLTEEDRGEYQCAVKDIGYTYIRLTVEGCILVKRNTTLRISAHTGGSVLLPCYCTNLRTSPGRFNWKTYTNQWKEISSESGQYRNRVQLVNGHSPGNLSLLISHLTEEDEGVYKCTVTGSEHTQIRLTVEGAPSPPSPPTISSSFFIVAAVGGVLLLMVLGWVLYWRYRAQRRGQKESCERRTGCRTDQETQDDVMYSTIDHSNASRPSHVLMKTGDTTEYASIKLN